MVSNNFTFFLSVRNNTSSSSLLCGGDFSSLAFLIQHHITISRKHRPMITGLIPTIMYPIIAGSNKDILLEFFIGLPYLFYILRNYTI